MTFLLSTQLVFLTSLSPSPPCCHERSNSVKLHNFRQHIAYGRSLVITYDVITSSLYSHFDNNPWLGLTSQVFITAWTLHDTFPAFEGQNQNW